MNKHPWVKSEQEFYNRYFKQIADGLNLKGNLKILDYGAGTGGFASVLAEHNLFLKIVAVDSNPEAIKLANQYYPHLSNIEFLLAKEVPRGKYDIIFCNLVLHELNNVGDRKTIISFLKKSYNSLKKTGRISIIDNLKISKKDFQKIYEKNKNPYKKSLNEEYLEHNRYALQDWINMTESAGFETEIHKKIMPNLFIYHGVKK